MEINSKSAFDFLSDAQLNKLYHDCCNDLNRIIFKNFTLGNVFRALLFGRSIKSNSISARAQNILSATDNAYYRQGFRPEPKKLRENFSYQNFLEIKAIIETYRAILDKKKAEILGMSEEKIQVNENEDDDFEEEIPQQFVEVDEAKILATLESNTWADLVKIQDKYTIRIGDGKYFVASNDIQIVLRDPSEQPAWGVWFLNVVPLEKIPDRAALLFLSKEELDKYVPEPIPDQLMICHASLWKMGEHSGVLLHVCWSHMSATYRWKIDKPLEIASVLFKTVSHPAQLARNFGFSPNLIVPGENWFL